MKKVAFLVLNYFINDSRVLREAISLKQKYTIQIIARWREKLAKQEIVDGIEVNRIKLVFRNLGKINVL